MRTLWTIMVCLLSTLPATAAEFTAGFELGHAAGTGGQLQLGVADFAVGFPGALRVSGSFAARDAGDPLAARHVFINDNTNGTPDETAAISVFSLDLVLPFTTFAGRPVQLYGGPRHARFKGTYEFIGGNEIFGDFQGTLARNTRGNKDVCHEAREPISRQTQLAGHQRASSSLSYQSGRWG